MPFSAAYWRRLWRFRGVAVDRLFPKLYNLPVPRASELQEKVELNISIPGCGRHVLAPGDAELVAKMTSDLSGWIAEYLPMQVVATDTRSFLPNAASGLAVQAIGGENEYLGSFDALLRVSAERAGVWRPYHDSEIALDIKVTGTSRTLGLNGLTLKTILTHARAVMQAARRERSRIGACRAVAFLFRRPAGPTFDGRQRGAAFGFVAIDTDILLQWNPTQARQAPATIVMSGDLLQRGATEEPEALPAAPPPVRPRPRDRWDDLAALTVRPGYVTAQDFCTVFRLGLGNKKKGAERVLKRVREEGRGANIHDWHSGVGSRRPYKICRISDLKHCYPGKR